MLHTILERESLGLEREICTPWEREDLEFPLFLTLFCFYLSIGYYSDHHNYVLCEYVWVVLAVRFRFLNRLIYVILHRRIRCLAMDGGLATVRLSPSFDTRWRVELAFQCHRFEVNPHLVPAVMPVLPKSVHSASREEAVEEMKDCRSTLQHWCRSTVMPEYGLSIFYDRWSP